MAKRVEEFKLLMESFWKGNPNKCGISLAFYLYRVDIGTRMVGLYLVFLA